MNKDIIVVGSVAFDDIETIKGRQNRLLGGSGVYFSLASSLFTKTHLIGIVGDDFNQDDIEMLHAKSISTNYLVHEKGKTFTTDEIIIVSMKLYRKEFLTCAILCKKIPCVRI